MAKQDLKLVKGFYDILPEDQKYWNFVLGNIKKGFELSGYSEITIPILEFTDLFKKSTGEDTDIVQKEMYSFKDLGGEEVTMRPEGTPGVARAYMQYGMSRWPQPVKVYYAGPMFRYDKPQAGRNRQFWQAGCEVFGEGMAATDAEVILTAYRILEKIGISNVALQVNSIGCVNCRNKYKEELTNYYRGQIKDSCEDCQKRLKANPLRLLDCKEKKCQKIAEGAPQIVDFLCKDCKEHFMEVLEYLDSMEISYTLNPFLVRGLDYYTKTVFEFWPVLPNDNGSNMCLGGGGRYDKLIESFGGKSTPACGMAFGIDRIIEVLKSQNISAPYENPISVFIIQLGDEARKKCLKLMDDLRRSGIGAESALSRDSIKGQMKLADKLGISTTLIIGQKEVMDDTVIIRDMNSGVQETVPLNEAVEELKRKLPR